MAPSDVKRIEQWPLERLIPHPKQGLLFSNPPESEVKELAEDMGRNGQLHPVEALPDGTTIAGHKRIAAASLLGWTELSVWVREDLADDPAAVEKRLIEDNLHRRQLGPLTLARCYVRLKELDKKTTRTALIPDQRQDLRDQIGKRLGVSGRTLDHYLRVLDGTPAAVQAAVEAGALPVTLAEQVAGLGKTSRAEIAEEIRNGGDPRKVVRRFLREAPRRVRTATKVAEQLLTAVAHGVEDLRGRVGEVRRIRASGALIEEGKQLLQQLQERAQELEKGKRPLKELFASLGVEIEEE